MKNDIGFYLMIDVPPKLTFTYLSDNFFVCPPYITLLLLSLTAAITATAQPTPTRPAITADSVAIFTVIEDALKQGREIIRQHVFVSHTSATPAGDICVAVFLWRCI
jgi:hypothetical protein